MHHGSTLRYLSWQGAKATVGLPVELHEDKVPDLQHVRIVHVDEVRCVPAAQSVVVDFATRSARPHLPDYTSHFTEQQSGSPLPSPKSCRPCCPAGCGPPALRGRATSALPPRPAPAQTRGIDGFGCSPLFSVFSIGFECFLLVFMCSELVLSVAGSFR